MRLTRTLIGLSAAISTGAWAQRAQENAVSAASDGFGATVGNERVGVYSTTNVRGFSPITAGNRRIEGLYFDLGGNGLTNRLLARSTVRVGLPALAYPFPAPSGIVDYDLRRPGTEAVLSAVGTVPVYGGFTLEVDGALPIGSSISLGAGAGLANNLYADGRRTDSWSVAVLPSLRAGGTDWQGFFGVSHTGGSVPPIMTTSGPVLPPIVDTRRFRSQKWIDNDQLSYTYGLLGRVPLGDALTLRLGAFESRSTRRRTFTDLFLDVQPDGRATEIVLSDPELPARWTSGEARLTWSPNWSGSGHQFVLAVRGRDKRLESGGSASAILGPTTIGTFAPHPRPDFAFSHPTVTHVRQGAIGLAYLGHLRGGWDINLGLQRVDYRSDFIRNDLSVTTRASPWLYNAMVTFAPAPWIGFYAGTARGLEESAPAPASAANRDEAVPAARTRQIDGGLRVTFGGIRLVAGAFRIERPYFSVDAFNLYRALGTLRNRGLEFSVVGNPTDRLSIVGGAVLMDPRVTDDLGPGLTRRRPVGATTRSARVDAEYVIDAARRASLTLGVQHSAAIAASTSGFASLDGRQLEIPGVTTFDLGARIRSRIGEIPVTIRAQLLDVFDARRLVLSSSNAFISSDRRRFTLQVSADF